MKPVWVIFNIFGKQTQSNFAETFYFRRGGLLHEIWPLSSIVVFPQDNLFLLSSREPFFNWLLIRCRQTDSLFTPQEKKKKHVVTVRTISDAEKRIANCWGR